MVEFPNKSIFMYSDSVDFRKGIKSLSNLIKTNYPDTNLTDSLFIFFSKDKRQVKILEIEDDDIWLYQNRLNNAKFVFPKCDKTIQIDIVQLKFILKSIELISHRKKWRPMAFLKEIVYNIHYEEISRLGWKAAY